MNTNERKQNRTVNRKTGGKSTPQIQKNASQGKYTPQDRATSTSSRRNESDLKNNLRSQTPLARQLRQKQAPDEPGTARRVTKPQYYRIKEVNEENVRQEKKRNTSLFFSRVALVLVLYLILMPISLLLFSLWLPHHSTPETENFTYQIGPDENYLSRRIYSWDTVRNGDTYYLDMTGIAELCDMITTGDSKSIKYTVRGTNESIEFLVGQSLAYLNGVEERMEAPCYTKDSKLYAPLEFISRCFSGLSVTLDTEKNKITVIRETDITGTYLTISFPFKPIESNAPIDFTSLDRDLREEILLREELNKPTAPVPEDQPIPGVE